MRHDALHDGRGQPLVGRRALRDGLAVRDRDEPQRQAPATVADDERADEDAGRRTVPRERDERVGVRRLVAPQRRLQAVARSGDGDGAAPRLVPGGAHRDEVRADGDGGIAGERAPVEAHARIGWNDELELGTRRLRRFGHRALVGGNHARRKASGVDDA